MWSGSDGRNMLCKKSKLRKIGSFFAKEVWENKRKIMTLQLCLWCHLFLTVSFLSTPQYRIEVFASHPCSSCYLWQLSLWSNEFLQGTCSHPVHHLTRWPGLAISPSRAVLPQSHLLILIFYNLLCVSTRDVQNAKRLGLKSICSRLDTTEAINRLRIWQIVL